MDYFCWSLLATGLCHQWKQFSQSASDSIEIYSQHSEYHDITSHITYRQYIDASSSLNIHDIAVQVLQQVGYYPSPYCLIDHKGQLQTATQFFLRNLSRVFSTVIRHPRLYVHYDRELISLPDGGTIAIDWASLRGTLDYQIPQLHDESPILLLHHGLVGDSQSEYLFHLARKMLKEGYRVGVMIARGCGGLKLTSPYTFSGRNSQDIRICIETVHKRYVVSNIFWIGFSLGAAATLQYLEDYHTKTLLKACMCVSPPWSLRRKQHKFDIWSILMTLPMKAYVLKHYDILRNNSEKYTKLSMLKFLTIRDIGEFDALCYRGYGGLISQASKIYSNLKNSFSKDNLTMLNQFYQGANRSSQNLVNLVTNTASNMIKTASSSNLAGLLSSSKSSSNLANMITPTKTIQHVQHEEQHATRSVISDATTVESLSTHVGSKTTPIHSHADYNTFATTVEHEIPQYSVIPATLEEAEDVLEQEAMHKAVSITVSSIQAEGNLNLSEEAIETMQYKTVDEYYHHVSPVHNAHLITTPTLSISSKDDPICYHTDCPTKKEELGPGLVVVKTMLGGHLAFPEGLLPLTRAWTDRVAIEWFAQFQK